jgi:tetratricopeptide (TPR) repeat protein
VSETSSSTNAASGPAARADALLELGRYAEAIPWLERAIADDPQSLEPRCQLGLAFVRLRHYGRALQAAERAVAVAPDHNWPHRIRALALLRTDRHQEALAAAHQAVRLAPELPDVYVICSEAELANDHKEAARSAAERAVSLAPEWAVARGALGEVLLELGQLASAEEQYRQALALDPLSFTAMNNLGVVLQRQGREREAMEQFVQAARLDPTSTLVQDNLAGSVNRHVDPRVRVSWPVQIGLIALGIVLPPVRLLFLVWWLANLIIRQSRMRALPPVARMAFRLRRRSRFSRTAVLFWLGVIGTLVFGVVGPAIDTRRTTVDLVTVYGVAGVCLLLAIVTGIQLWRRWRARRATV